MKYKKINKIDVLNAFYKIENIDPFTGKNYPVSRKLIAYSLNTSLYQVNKICKELIKEGLLQVKKYDILSEYDYWEGWTYKSGLLTPITEITDKGIKLLERETIIWKI